MQRRTLGKSGIEVGEISLGCWAIGGPSWRDGNPVGWAGADDDQSLAGLRRAHELGINHLDTADVYGDGHSEQLIGRFLREVSRESLIIASKVGWFKGTAPNAMQPLHVRHQLEQTLHNLGTDYLDIHYFHNTNFGPDDRYLEESADLMRSFQKEGKVRAIGQSAYSYADFQRVCPVVRPDVIQFNYSALGSPFDDPEPDLFAWAEEQGYGMVMFGPLGQGLLLDKFDPENPPKFGEGDVRSGGERFGSESLRKLRERLAPIKDRFGSSVRDLARVALQYPLARTQHGCVIPGFKNPEQVEINASAADKPLSPEDVEFIRKQLQE
jgi:myo-inositol catabolism protein IolS